MGLKMPIDPTTLNPQDPKDAPQSRDGRGSDFIPYVSAWERLPDTVERVTAGRRPKELAQADLCRAIADGAVKIRCELQKQRSKGFTSRTVLEGKNFEIPAEIKPEDLDWERSRPLKPWLVRRECYSMPGYWDLAWIEVCRADVTKVLCVAKEQDENTQHAASETPATRRRPPALESQEMPVGSGRRSTAGPRKPAGPARRRGARPQKFEQTKESMRNDLQHEGLTVAQLENMLEKNLATKYGVSRDTARKARSAVLSELNSRQSTAKDK
jgi:hypothetical protein